MFKKIFLFFLFLTFLFLPPSPFPLPAVYAHEAYVLPKGDFQQGLLSNNLNIFSVLQNQNDLMIFLSVSFAVTALITTSFLFYDSKFTKAIDKFLTQFSSFGPIVTRLTLAASLFFSALTFSFLGSELSLGSLPLAGLLRTILFIASGLFLLGFLTELAALACLLIFILGMIVFGPYQLSYLNYFGELVVLAILGSRFFSVDQKLFGQSKKFTKIKEYETTIVRVFYGAALLYAAITVKLLHPQIPLDVVNQYNLTQFNLLFPKDPMLVVLGAALAEITIGIFIIIGFQLRLVILISLFYITLSLFFFKEAVWPHLLLYGISLNLLTVKSKFSLDEYLGQKKILQEKLVFP